MNPKPHYSEADLLETYYTQPGESLPVMMHLADCEECVSRYERLEQKIRGLGACGHHDEKPETFWARQRMSILRRIAREERPPQRPAAIGRFAAAAAIVLAIGGGAVLWDRGAEPIVSQQATTTQLAAPVPQEAEIRLTDSTDPWQSDELDEFGSLVEWESWVENGDQSL